MKGQGKDPPHPASGQKCRVGVGVGHLYLSSTICSCPGLRLPALGLMEKIRLSSMRIWWSSVQSNSICSAHSSKPIFWSLGKRKALEKGAEENVGDVVQRTGRYGQRVAGALCSEPCRTDRDLAHTACTPSPSWQVSLAWRSRCGWCGVSFLNGPQA